MSFSDERRKALIGMFISFRYLFMRREGREQESESERISRPCVGIPQVATMARMKPEMWNSIWISHMDAATQVLGPSFAPFSSH